MYHHISITNPTMYSMQSSYKHHIIIMQVSYNHIIVKILCKSLWDDGLFVWVGSSNQHIILHAIPLQGNQKEIGKRRYELTWFVEDPWIKKKNQDEESKLVIVGGVRDWSCMEPSISRIAKWENETLPWRFKTHGQRVTKREIGIWWWFS